MGLLKRIANKLEGTAVEKPVTAGVDSPAEPVMEALVRRFQGRYECGCEVDRHVPQPLECEIHGRPAVYSQEALEINNVIVGGSSGKG